MGLDWRPMGKPKPGFQDRFKQIFMILTDQEGQKLNWLDKLKGRKTINKNKLVHEWLSISDTTYETIRAPKVGRDKIADDWIKQKYIESDKSVSEHEFVNHFLGYYVIELAEELDGVPVYTAAGQDENVFRGQFLQDCKELLGEDLLNEAWETKFAEDALNYGHRLMEVADKAATKSGVLYLKTQRMPPDTDEKSIESKVHILYSAAKWLIFYGRNGHGYEADF